MEYVYASLILNKFGKEINEDNIKKIITAAGGKVDDGKVKMVVVALKDVNIEEVIKNAAIPVVSVSEEKKEKKEEKKEEHKKSEDEAAAGLGALFG